MSGRGPETLKRADRASRTSNTSKLLASSACESGKDSLSFFPRDRCGEFARGCPVNSSGFKRSRPTARAARRPRGAGTRPSKRRARTVDCRSAPTAPVAFDVCQSHAGRRVTTGPTQPVHIKIANFRQPYLDARTASLACGGGYWSTLSTTPAGTPKIAVCSTTEPMARLPPKLDL